MTATTMLLVVAAAAVSCVWGETFIPSLRDQVESEEPPVATTFDPYSFPEYTTLNPILLDDTDIEPTTIPTPDEDLDHDPDTRPVTVAPPIISVRKIPSLSSSSFRVRPAFASRKGSVQGLTPSKISLVPAPAPAITPRKVAPIRIPSPREIIVFDSSKAPTPIAVPVPTGRKMPSLSSRKNSAFTDISRETLVSDYSPAFTTRNLPPHITRKAATPVSSPREYPTLSVLRIRPVPSSILRNRQAPSSLSPSPVEFPEPDPFSPIIIQRPSTTPPPPVKRRPIPAPSSIRVQRPVPVPSSPILIKRPSPLQSSSIRMLRPIFVPAPSSIRITPLGTSPTSSSTEKLPSPTTGKHPVPPTTSSSSGFGKSFDASPAPVQSTPITSKVKFPSLLNPRKRPILSQFSSSSSVNSTSAQPNIPSPSRPKDRTILAQSSVRNTPVASPSWPEDSFTLTRSSFEIATSPSRTAEVNPIAIPSSRRNNPIASRSSSEDGPRVIPSSPSSLKQPSSPLSLKQSAPPKAFSSSGARLSPTPMLRLTAARSPISSPRVQPTQTVSIGSRNRFLAMLKRKQEVKENNVIGKSPCQRGVEGRSCRRRLSMDSRTCSSGSCQKCRRGCSNMEPSEWPSCCRDHLLCCRHLAASCRRCDQPQLFPFCSAAFKKCV